MTPSIRKLLELAARVLESEPRSEERNALYAEIQDALDRAKNRDDLSRMGAPELNPPEEYL